MRGDRDDGSLGLPELLAMGVGGMIGGGIFSVLGLAVEESGHAAPLAFLAGGLIALVAGYSYVRLALTYRVDGASFTYLERAFPKHPFLAGTAGWTVVVGYVGTLALYAYTFGAYGSHLLGEPGPGWMRAVLSGGALLVFLAINLAGTGAMGRLEDVIVAVKVAFLAVLAVAGFTVFDPARGQPIFDHGVPAVFLGGALIFVAFEGFQLITNAVVETREPERNVPRAIYGSIAITTAIYVLIAFVAVGTLAPGELRAAGEYALAVVAEPVFGRVGVALVDLAAMLATASAINATLFGSARLASQIASDHLAPRVFSFRSRNDAPAVGLVVITALAALLTALGGLETIASLSSLTFLLVSIGVCVANLRLRRSTRSAPLPIVLGLALMAAAVSLLVLYLAEHDPGTLLFCGIVYAAVALAHLLFERVVRPRARAPRRDA